MVAASLVKQTQIKFNKTLAELYSCFEELGFRLFLYLKLSLFKHRKSQYISARNLGKVAKELERFSWNNLESVVLWSREVSEYNDTRGNKGERRGKKRLFDLLFLQLQLWSF